MQYALELTLSGIAIGSIYGLMAMAFALIYRSTGILNFAQGEIGMLIAYITWSINTAIGPSPWIIVMSTLVVSVIVGLVIERVIMRRLLGEPVFSAVIVTVGLGVIIQAVVLMIWGGESRFLELGRPDAIVDLAGTRMRQSQIAVAITLVVVLIATWAFFKFSRFGIAMRAVAEDQRTARLMGISPQRVQSVAWMASSLLAGMAGVFFAITLDLSPVLFTLGLKSFPATVVGGLDAVVGSGAAGILIGVIENIVGGYIAPQVKEIAGFVMILVILMVRPFGLFGQKEIERV